jgi:hypothetical protein
MLLSPPAIRTWPFASIVAVCSDRGVIIFPTAVNVPGDWAFALSAANKIPARVLIVITPSPTSLNRQGDFIARTAEVVQAHGHG